MHRFRFHWLTALLVLALAISACDKKDDAPSNDKGKDSTSATKDGGSSSDASEGKKLASEAGRFSVQFPGGFPDAKESSQNVSTKIGDLTMYTYLTEMDSAACMVAYSDYPDKAFEGADIDALLDSARNGALNNVKGTMESEEKIELNGHPGRSVIFTGNSGGTTIHGRFDYYLIKPRLYQVGFMSLSRDKVADPGVMAYFKSFGVNESKAPSADGK